MECLEARGGLVRRVGGQVLVGGVLGDARRHAVAFLENLLVRVGVAAVVGDEPHYSVVQPLRVVGPPPALDASDPRTGMDKGVGRDPDRRGSVCVSAFHPNVVLHMLGGNDPAAGGQRLYLVRIPLPLRNGLHRLQKAVGMLVRPGFAAVIDERDVVVVTQAVGRGADRGRGLLVDDLDLDRLIDVGRIVVSRGALVFLPMEYEPVRVQLLENELVLGACRRDLPTHLHAERPGRR